MDQDDELDHEGNLAGTDKAFTVIRELPPTRTAKQQRDQEQKRTLELYPELYKGEPEEYRLKRAEAHRTCWKSLLGRFEDTLRSTDAHVFGDLLAFCRSSHKPPRPGGPLNSDGFHRLPTALVLAGGVNSADHSQTFPSLAKHLREQGAYVALLQPHSFGRVVGTALNEVLRQFSGLDTQAQHMEALVAWYEDEVGHPEKAPTMAAAPAEQAGITSPQLGGNPCLPEQQDQHAEHGGDDLQQEGRQLRRRPAPTPGGKGASGATGRPPAAAAGVTAARREAARERPLVVIVEGTEGVDPCCLRDVLLTLSEAHAQLPVTVMLGLTTAEGALHEMLSSEVTDRCMDCRSFKLASAMARLNRLVSEVLLGGAGSFPGLAFDYGVVSKLLNKFFTHYFSIGVIKQGLQLACLEHFRTCPASFLAEAAQEGPQALRAACAKLPAAVAAKVKEQCGGRGGGARLADTILEAVEGWRHWAVALHWLAAAAAAVGLRGKWCEHFALFWDGLNPSFPATTTAAKLVPKVLAVLRQLPSEQVWQLAQDLQSIAERFEGTNCALDQELEQLRSIAEEPAQAQPGERNGQGQQQQQQGGGADARQADTVAGEAQEGDSGSGAAAAAVAPAQEPNNGAAGNKPKRDRFHSKASRQQALLQKTAQASTAARGEATAAAEKKAQEAAAPGSQLANWLERVLSAALAAPPTKLPGAAVFSCKAAAALNCLSGAPRQVVHVALTEPHTFLKGQRSQVGCHAGMEDACLAYTIFDQDPNCVNVADWFQAFLEVHEQEHKQQGHRGSSKKATVKRRGKGPAEQDPASKLTEEEDALRQRRQRELAARFTQATAELQLTGFIRPAKKRRGDFVQRLVHMPAATLE